ncbi:hypothetical protein GOP47_0020614 [Adiantum capillus-veneris]|uniref:tRNA(Ile)-lysidine synthetase n=1 Tax=Adiantum capillus-veneris TaxID=13818 RepID=A0A9D4UB38_ADICA|nr:hypothetical protein GOP47_0020614 [Adiantum capillus-veneris]
METSEAGQKREYDILFASRMAGAGLSSTTRIGIAVSGGADSTALCILASRWILQNGGSSANLLGLIVDHGLRIESASEALAAQSRIASLGIRCEILKCFWPVGVPAHGHLQEAARNARYDLIQKACKRNNMDVLLTAHHLDDQIELFIIRSTRHSGLAGLAGMPFISKLHRCIPEYGGKDVIHALLLVRPLLGLSKNDLYKVCKIHDQLWVEDPTNKKPIFLRNVVRSILTKPDFCMLRKELPPLIILCGNLRTLFDKGRDFLLREAVSIDEVFGYVILDLEKLKHARASEQSIKRMLVAVLQFVAQKEKPPRGNIVQSLVAHINSNPLKGALTLAGCNVCMEPGSKQSRIIICASCESKLPASGQPMNVVWTWDPGSCSELCAPGLHRMETSVATTCIMDNKLGNDSTARFMKVESPLQFLTEAREVGMLSERSFVALSELMDKLSLKSSHNLEEGDLQKRHVGMGGRRSVDLEVPCGHACYFMNRFWIAWGTRTKHQVTPCNQQLAQGCELVSKESSCMQPERPLWIRYMEEKDWIFLSQCIEQKKNVRDLSSGGNYKESSFWAASRRDLTQQNAESYKMNETQHRVHALPCCFSCWGKRVQDAVAKLKRMPVPVRRGLPVFVTSQGALISIPSLGFSLCPNIWVFSRFCPKVPLGGGTASWL